MKFQFRKLYLALTFLFLYAPIIVLIVFSFNDSRLRGSWEGFTLKWYVELFQDREVMQAMYNTILIAVLTTIISTVIGVLAAMGISNYSKLWKGVVLNLNYIPVLNPDIVTAVSLMVLYGAMQMKFGLFTMLLSHVAFTIPYVVLSILPKLKQMNRHIPEAAMDLGATPLEAFLKVVLPEIQPGIATGAMLAFTLSIDDFVISFFTTGHGVANISTTVFSMARRGINPIINALSTLMFVAMLLLLILINRNTKTEDLY
ncbi:MAG: ABC transporter permease [Tissierellia bacterium]|nr:ABC transporter permease [Tissierellia bacterium]